MAREQRKLAAILAADVIGYFCLMRRDASGTLARFRSATEQRKHLFQDWTQSALCICAALPRILLRRVTGGRVG